MKHLLRNFQLALCVMLASVLMACSSLGVPAADTFKKKLAGGYATVEAVAKTASQLRAAGKLSDTDRANVVATNANVIAGLDIAASVSKTDLGAADAKLTATLAVLTALQAYLATQGAQP